MPTVAEIIAQAQADLNDANARVYKTDTMLPFVQAAADKLHSYLVMNGVPVVHEISTEQTITAAVPSEFPPLGDMIQPISVYERTPGSQEIWDPLVKKDFEPNIQIGPFLRFWTWRREVIHFPGSLEDRAVLVRYRARIISTTLTENSSVGVVDSKPYLAFQAASFAAMSIGRNPQFSEELAGQASEALDVLLVTSVRNMQNLPVRRKRFVSNLRRR